MEGTLGIGSGEGVTGVSVFDVAVVVCVGMVAVAVSLLVAVEVWLRTVEVSGA